MSRRTSKPSGASWQPIYDGILAAVLHHRLAPGAKLVEEDIATIYAVSRTVVRAALQALARDGIVILTPNKGASVARPTPAEAREIFEARALIEPEIAILAARRMEAGDATALRAAIEAEHHALHAGRQQEAVFHSADFHRRIAAIAGHRVLREILNELLSRSSLVISLYWRQPATLCDNHAHLELADALSRGDENRSADLMRHHILALLGELDFSQRPPPSSDLATALKPVGREPESHLPR